MTATFPAPPQELATTREGRKWLEAVARELSKMTAMMALPTDHAALTHLDYPSSGHSGFVPDSRTLSAGTGLLGGGDLSANRALSIASNQAFGVVTVIDDPYDATGWNGSVQVPTKNALRDKIEALGTGMISDDAYDSTSWNGVTSIAPSKNSIRDRLEDMSVAIAALIEDAVYDASAWDGITAKVPSKNAIRDKIESMVAAYTALVSDTAYNAGTWDGVTTIAPSKNAVRDRLEAMATAYGALVSDSAYASGWNGVGTVAPSQNAVYDMIAALFPQGSYTPTLTNATNLSASTPAACPYARIVNQVFVNGLVGVDPVTASNQIVLHMTLPIASALGAFSQLTGVAFSENQVFGCSIQGVNVGGVWKAAFVGIAPSTAATTLYFQFSYPVI